MSSQLGAGERRIRELVSEGRTASFRITEARETPIQGRYVSVRLDDQMSRIFVDQAHIDGTKGEAIDHAIIALIKMMDGTES